MTSSGQVKFKEIRKMLDACAPGAVIEHKLHHTWITWGGKTYRGLPLGAHGSRKNPEIEVGHVKRMARFFEILPCARKEIEALR